MARWAIPAAHRHWASLACARRDRKALFGTSKSSGLAAVLFGGLQSSGIELMHNAVIVMGNSPAAASPTIIGHAVMRDAIDAAAVMEALESVGLGAGGTAVLERLVNIFAKAEAAPDGTVRGFRHTHAGRFRHRIHPPCACRRRRPDRRPVRHRCGLCLRRR